MKRVFWMAFVFISISWQNSQPILAQVSLDKIEHNLASKNNNSELLEQQAKELYKTGILTEAIPLLKKAIDRYRRQEKVIKEATATRNLALIYQQLGQWEQTKKTINSIDNLLPKITSERERKKIIAQTLEVRGQLELSLNQADVALATWQEAATNYQQIGDFTGYTTNQIYQAQALRTQGLYARAIKTLTQVKDNLKTEPDNLLKAKALHSIGDVLRRVGQYQQSRVILDESLAIAKQLSARQETADILLSLGSTTRAQKDYQTAFAYYQRAIAISSLPEQQILGKLNQLSLLIDREKVPSALVLVTEIEQLLSKLPSASSAIDSRISLARSLMNLQRDFPQQSNVSVQKSSIIPYLADAIALARSMGDRRRESEAMGNLGTLYEENQQLEEAQKLTEEALIIAKTLQAPDLSYQWHWQLGRILRANGESAKAIAAYTQSIDTLASLRSDLVAISSEVRFSFRENVEPVYRQLVDLLLQPTTQAATQTNLKQAREVIESLQLAELDNFFRDACVDTEPVQIDQLDPQAAVLYPIILGDRLEVIAALPGQPLRHYTTDISPQEIEIDVTSIISLVKLPQRRLNLIPFQKAYQWLIAPIAAELATNKIETIVFIPDGILRNLPPAVLHDGDRYLVEKYNLAIAPGLQLVDSQPISLTKKRELLLAGLTEARQGFSPLPGVNKEVRDISTLYPAEIILNSSFTEDNFNQVVKNSNYKVIHLATHGKFSSNLDNTFVLTWDERLNINELNELIRADSKQFNPVELLVLSACETAIGDKQAALGLAGIAVRAGARSTMASLWDVSDEATVMLMTNFYRELKKTNITKAEALRIAQQQVLQEKKFSHPYFWSAFILVGNWL